MRSECMGGQGVARAFMGRRMKDCVLFDQEGHAGPGLGKAEPWVSLVSRAHSLADAHST